MARESRDTWTKRVERWAESGLTAKEFAAEVGVNAPTLMQWKYRLAAEARRGANRPTDSKPEAVDFVEVAVAQPEVVASPNAAPSALELVFANGATLRVPADFDAATLRRLLDVMTTR
jgi:hypothetical protein